MINDVWKEKKETRIVLRITHMREMRNVLYNQEELYESTITWNVILIKRENYIA